MAALVLVCACSNPSAGEAAPPLSAHKASSASPPTPRDFLQPPPPSSKSAAAAASQGRALADSASSHDSSVAQRVARWFFSPDAPPAPPQEIQERKPPHGAPPTGFGPPGGKYGPPKAFNQYGPPKGAGGHGHGHGPPPPPPPPGDYGPPKHSSGHYGPPKPVPLHNGPPSGPRRPSSGRYGPPKPHSPHHLGPPPPAPGRHGPPSGHPSGQFGPPKSPSPGPAYGPPSHQAPAPISSGSRPGPPSHNKGRDCNPCNKVPWIPMSRTPAGVSDQVLSLVTPPEAHSGNGGNQYLPPGPSQGKIPPFTPLKTFSGDYGPPAQAGEPEGQYTAPAAHGELPLKGPAGQYGPPAGATAPADDYGPPPPAPSGHFSTTGGAQGAGPAFGPGGPSGHGGHGGLGGHGGHGGPGGHGGHGGNGGHGHGHGGHGGQGPAPSDDYGPPPLPPLLQAPAAPHGNYVPPSQLQPPSAPHPPPHPTAIGGGGHPQLALAPSFLPAPPVHNARPFHGPAPAVADYLTPPGTGSSVGGAFLGPAPQHPGAAFASGPGPSGPGPALSAPGHGSAPGPGADLDVIKSVTVYTDSQSSAQHSLGADQLGDVYNGDAKQVHLVPDGHGHNAVDQLHLPSGDNDAPVSEDGNHIITHDHSNSQHNTTDDSLEVIKSVRVADFLSSVEYPPEVIQSPYIDLTPPPSGNKDQYSTTFNHAYSSNISPHEEIIVGKPAVNNGDNRNTFQQASASENSPPIKEQLQHHLESNHPQSDGALGPSPNESSAASQTYHSTHSSHHFGTDQKPSSTNKDVVNGPSASSHSSHLHDLNLSGNNLYSSGSLPGSIIRNEEHPSQGLSKNISSSTRSPLEIHSQSQDHVHVITGNEDRQPSQSVLHTGQGIQVPTAPHGLSAPGTQGVLTSPGVQSTSAPQHVAGTQGTQSSVIVDIQPSLQTSAQGASLIYQINGLNTPPSQFQHAYPNTPAQTSVFVSFQHAPQKPFNYPPPSLLNQQLPPPAPFQNTFHQPPPAASAPFAAFQTPPPPPSPAYQPAFPPDAPVSYLNPPAHPFKGFNAATPSPAVAAPPPAPAPAAESHPHPAWSSASAGGGVGGAALKPPKAESDAAYLAGLLPPPPPRAAQPAAANDGKRTKQIQIIVPYTSSKDLIQFRFPGANPAELDASGWSPIANPEPASNQGRIVPGPNNCSDIIADGSIDSPLWQEQAALCRAQVTTVGQSLDAQDDYHLHQESRRVTAKAPLGEKLPPNHKNKPFVAKPGSQTGEIQHIFASNIRDLLRGEEEAKPTADSINLLKLQKNIDEWTAQEFSKHKHLGSNHKTTEHDKGFTASFATGTTLHHLRLPSKQIPEEYLTTTPLSVDDTDPTDLFSPTLPPTYKINDISRTSPSSLFFDHEVSGSHTHSITANAVDKPENKSSGSRNKSSNDATWKFFESNLVLPEAVTVTTTTQIPTTTDEFTAETTDTTEPTIQANWDHLEVSISPITKEKVYVVTPLSTWVAPSLSTTPSSPRFTSSGIYQALSRSPTSPRPSPTSINDIIPFRKSVLSPADMLGVTPLPFHSPRFLIRPTPGPSLHRLFTMKASEAGYTPPSPSPPLDAAHHAPAHRDDEEADAGEDAATAAATAPDAATEDNSIHDDLYTLDHDERESSTPAADNSTASRSRGAATLLGLTDLPTYTPPDGARVHTYSGHSKVVTVVTPPTLVTPKKKPAAGFGDKKATTSAASKTASATATAITSAGEPLAPTSPAPPAAFGPASPAAGGDARPSTPRKEPEAYLWHFPELLTDGDELHEEDVAAVREAALDLQKEKRT